MSILSDLQDAYKEGNNAKILNLVPDLIKAIEEGRIVELPCAVDDTVFIIEKNDNADCEKCVYGKAIQSDYYKCKRPVCPGTTYEIKEKECEGFVIGYYKNRLVSEAGEWGCEGLEELYGTDGKCYYTLKEAEEALKKIQSEGK